MSRTFHIAVVAPSGYAAEPAAFARGLDHLRSLGHSQYQTTLRYAHLADTQLRQAAEHISKAIAETKGNAGKVIPLPQTARS